MARPVKTAPRRSWQIALCGVLAAVSVALMLLGAAIPLAMFIAPALSGVLVMLSIEECGSRLAWTMYAAISLLSLVLVPDREVALVFITLLGYYPMVKPAFDRLRPLLRLLVKTALFAASMGCVYGLLLILFPVAPADEALTQAGMWLAAATLAMGYLAFLLYDRALANLLRLYRLVWQPKLHRMLRF